MKIWHLLVKKIELWHKKDRDRKNLYDKIYKTIKDLIFPPNPSKKSYVKGRSYRKRIRIRHCIILAIFALTSLTYAVSYRFYNQPQLKTGTISPVTIKAPRDAKIEDTKTTEQKRRQVQTGITPILKINNEVNVKIKGELAEYIKQVEQIRNNIKSFPFIDIERISLASQKYIRSCNDSEIKQILKEVDNRSFKENIITESSNNKESLGNNLIINKVISELQLYKKKATSEEYKKLLNKIIDIRSEYNKNVSQLKTKELKSITTEEIDNLLDISDRDWEITKESLYLVTERILAQGIAPGLPNTIRELAVNLQLNGTTIPPEISHLSANFLLGILEPNLEEDNEATLKMAEQAVSRIDPVIAEVKKGDIIIAQGEKISQDSFVLLDHFALSRRSINWQGVKLSGVIVSVAITIFVLFQRRVFSSIRRRDYLLICLLSLTTPVLGIFEIPYTNLPAIGLLMSSFYGSRIAICHISLLIALVTFATPTFSWEYFLAGSIGGIISAIIAGRLRSREAIAKLGIIVGLTQGTVYFITNLILSAAPEIIWSAILPGSFFYGLSGVAWSIVGIGISPYLERLFDLITPIRLAELSNPNLPLLKRLATEAPGTFQHTMAVASLAESAARRLNCNVELVRAGTLYHDIGKMHDPLGFIENQMGEPNKHDKINNPWESTDIIRKHVTEGLVIAKKYGLPKAIRDFIPQHQGTLLISYFYHQAKKIGEKDPTIEVHESDFRYDGPIPQSREAAIMMLADGSEAALRSMKNATPEQALSTMKKIFKARWKDDQLIDSNLAYEELPIIAEVFVQVWQQFNHKRVVYPKGALDSN